MVTLEMLEPVFRDLFDDDTISLNCQTTADDVDGWDSLTHVNLAIAFELRFTIKFAL